MIVKTGQAKLPEISVRENGKEIKGKKAAGGHLEFEVAGNAELHINWK